MTFDLDVWPFTSWTYEGFHIISINQVWFKSDFNFSNEAIFTFSAYLTTWRHMTFDFDIRPSTSSTNEGSHVASMTQLWLKSIKAWGRWSQMLTPFHNRQQQQHQQTTGDSAYVSFLLRHAGDTKTSTLARNTMVNIAVFITWDANKAKSDGYIKTIYDLNLTHFEKTWN